MRRFHRTSAKDHLAATPRLARLALHIGDPDRALAVEEDTRGERISLDAQIGAAPRRIQKGARRRPASAIFLRRLEIAEAFLVAVVVVRVEWEALEFAASTKA
jgi:DUF1365 family protein